MADPLYHPCEVCKESTKHTADLGEGSPRGYRTIHLCRDKRCREIMLGAERAAADTHRYLTDVVCSWCERDRPRSKTKGGTVGNRLCMDHNACNDHAVVIGKMQPEAGEDSR